MSHHGPDCTFETVLRRYELIDPGLWKLAEAVHESDIEDDRCDAPEAARLDAVLRGLSMTLGDPAVLATTGPLFNDLDEYYRRATLLGRPPPEAPPEQEQKCRSILTIPHPPRPPGTSPPPARSR